MSLVIVETAADQPITDEYLHIADQQMLPCLTARNITWNFSFLSTDRYRMICTFNAPDAGSVREAYRWAGQHRTIWASDLIESDPQPQQNFTTLQIMEATYPPLSEGDWHTISRTITVGCTEHSIEWLRLYLSLDRKKIMCQLNAPDSELVQEVLNKGGISFDRVWSAQLLLP